MNKRRILQFHLPGYTHYVSELQDLLRRETGGVILNNLATLSSSTLGSRLGVKKIIENKKPESTLLSLYSTLKKFSKTML